MYEWVHVIGISHMLFPTLLVTTTTVNKFLKSCPSYDSSKVNIRCQLSERPTFHTHGSFLAKVPSVHVPQEIASP